MRNKVEVVHEGIRFIVEGTYEAGEPATYNYGDGTGDPAGPARFNIAHIFVGIDYQDIYEVLTESTLEQLEDLAIAVTEACMKEA